MPNIALQRPAGSRCSPRPLSAALGVTRDDAIPSLGTQAAFAGPEWVLFLVETGSSVHADNDNYLERSAT
jgi:hypothetical protein